MSERIDPARRQLLGTAALTLASSKLGALGTLMPELPGAPESTDVRRHASPLRTFDQIHQIRAGELDVGYATDGPDGATPVLLLHGWPYDIHSYATVAPLLAARGYRVIVPFVRGHGTTRFLSAGSVRNGQQAVLARDVIDLMDALGIQRATIAGVDWGSRTANVVAALWPERCRSMVAVSGYLIGNRNAGGRPLTPREEWSWWYQYYFATERGREGYAAYRREFAKLIWQLASPKWAFDDATFAQSAQAFDNPDHVDIVIHNYRWRLGLAEGDSRYDAIEQRLAAGPVIAVPSVTLEGDANGAPHPDSVSYARKFTGPYAHRIITRGIGHNLPQEAPHAFADAVVQSNNL
ncbi:MAG: alpha/beta hydrolase [Phycisphaerae bacterium]|nr:alpha/beta hydrolase [Gemmatimonadaceae bacterium]